MCEFMSFMQIWLQMNYRLYIIYYRVSLEKASIGIPYCMWKIKLMIILIKYEAPKKIEQGRGKMKKIISNLSVMIFVIGCAIMEITTWFIDSYVMFYIGIIIVIVGIIGMIIQGKFKKVIEFIIEYF